MSESTPNDTPQPDQQHESWDDILSQPIARLANDTTAGEGGWRAVRDISSFSPRRQDVPAQIPSPDSVLRLHLPQQSEVEAPQQAKLPDSLADQLSLTWSARKRQRPVEEPEDEPQGPVWPSSTPAVSAPQPKQALAAPSPAAVQRGDAPQASRPEAPLWRRPMDLVTRALRRDEPKKAETEQTAAVPVQPAQTPAQAAALVVRTPAAPQTQAPSPSQPRTTVQRTAEPAPRVTSRLDAADTEAEQPPQEPGAGQQQAPVDMTLAMQPKGQASQAATTPSSEEERNDTSAPQPRADAAVQRLPEAPAMAQPSLQREEQPATAQPRPAAAGPGRSQAAVEEQPSLPEVARPERRSFLSWLRPRYVARAPVDRALPSTADVAPAMPEPTVQRAAATPRAATSSSEPGSRISQQRTSASAQQPGVSLPTAGAPLTHRSLGTPVQADDATAPAETPAQPAAASISTPSSAPAATPAPAPTSAPEPGDPLPPGLQQRMEGLLDVPLREVRVFRGQTSQRITSSLRADAVTVGNQVHVARGRGDASSPQGRALLGHELSHVATRQGSGASEPAQPRSDDKTPESAPAAMPLPANVSPAEDESRAMRLEHAILRAEAPQQPARPAARPAPAPTPPLSLEHRAPPPQIVMSPEAMTTMHSVHDDGWGGQASAFEAALHGAAAAPWDRLAGEAESMAGSAASSAMDNAGSAASSAVSSAAGAAASAAGDEEGLVDRVVEAVIQRIEHEGNVARERSSSFVPHFGG